jgi:hypothetical protein
MLEIQEASRTSSQKSTKINQQIKTSEKGSHNYYNTEHQVFFLLILFFLKNSVVEIKQKNVSKEMCIYALLKQKK